MKTAKEYSPIEYKLGIIDILFVFPSKNRQMCMSKRLRKSSESCADWSRAALLAKATNLVRSEPALAAHIFLRFSFSPFRHNFRSILFLFSRSEMMRYWRRIVRGENHGGAVRQFWRVLRRVWREVLAGRSCKLDMCDRAICLEEYGRYARIS